MTEELRLWTVGKPKKVKLLESVQEMSTELELEDLLVQNPEMLELGLELVGRQTPTESGWLDLLAVDENGRLVVYELKRGKIVREAVAQVLDYASDLDSMNTADLAKHIAERSGNDGIQGIDDFEQWYSDNFGEYDPSRLRPPRMVLIGLGVDPVAERMVRFISGGPVDVSIVTFQGFRSGNNQLLARQMKVQPRRRQSGYGPIYETVAERHKALQEYLTHNCYKKLFDQVYSDLRQSLPERGVWEEPGKTGISFQLNEPDNPKKWKTYFGVQAGYLSLGYSVSILPGAIHWGEDAFEELGKLIDLSKRPPGGFAISFDSEKKWKEFRQAVLGFVKTVIENRVAAAKPGT